MPFPEPILLTTVKTRTTQVELRYRQVPCPPLQARFLSRYALAPEIDLQAYECRALIDWVQVKVVVSQPTQFQWIQKAMKEAIGQTVYAEVDAADRNGSGATFSVRFQEPNGTMLDALRAVHLKFGFVTEPVVEELEVSVDFLPKSRSAADRATMHGVLARHHLPSCDFIGEERNRPRFSWARMRPPTFVLRRTGRRAVGAGHFASVDDDQAVPTDATYYTGEQGGRASWRVMTKEIDRQNPDAGSFTSLRDAEKRARIEVTLNQEELASIGIGTVRDLTSFRFPTMQGRYFHFALPTFQRIYEGRGGAARAWQSGRREQKFRGAGIVGLIALDAVSTYNRAAARQTIVAASRRSGRMVSKVNTHGTGTNAHMVAYEELNARVQSALAHLGERIARWDKEALNKKVP